jgi:bacillithiol biosynthesis deacetylase BshB1
MKLHILAFAAHPDDVEISSSGTLIKHIQMGYACGIADLTRGEMGTRGTADLRDQESAEASKVMGLSARENLNLGDCFFEYTQENLMRVIEVIRKYQPEIVIANAPEDRHPDHGRASKLVSDACFYAGLPKIETSLPAWRPKSLFYYLQDRYLKPDFVVDITAQMPDKIKALMCYSSQFYNPESKEPTTPISTPEFLEFLQARFRELARPIGTSFAEGFICDRTPGVSDFFKLI